MDEMYEWLRARRKRRIRIVAALLGVGVLFTSIPQLHLPEYDKARAKEEQIHIIGEFAALPEEVREQTVAFGTSLKELELPDGLEAYMTVKNAENIGGGVKPDEDSEGTPDAPDSDKDDSAGEEGVTDGDTDGNGEDGTGEGDEGAGTEEDAGDGEEGEGGDENAGDGSDGSGEDEDAGEGDDGSGEDEDAGEGDDGSGEDENAGDGSDGSGGEENAGDGSDGSGEDENTGDGDDGSGGEENAGDGDGGEKGAGKESDGSKSVQEYEAKAQVHVVSGTVRLPGYMAKVPEPRIRTIYPVEAAEGAEAGKAFASTEGAETGKAFASAGGAEAGKAFALAEAAGTGAAANGEETEGAADTRTDEAETKAGGKTDDGTGTTEEEAGDGTGTTEEAAGNGTGTTEEATDDGTNTAEEETADDGDTGEKGEWAVISGVTWESSPAYDGGTPGTYTFTAVLPEMYELAEGVFLPVITVTVQEEEGVSEMDYVTFSFDEVAPLTTERDAGAEWNVSSDNAGDSYRIRALWKTIDPVSTLASSKYCRNSWVSLKVPGMQDQKYHFDKDMLRNSSRVYKLGEFTLPYTYEDSEEIFPAEVGIYTEVAALTGVFKGELMLQSYNYITGEWVTYHRITMIPHTTDTGGSALASEKWEKLDGMQNWIAYIDIDQNDLYLQYSEDVMVQRSWDMVCMDRFGVVVTEKSKGWSSSWELGKEGGGSYPAQDKLSVTGGMESFTVTAASGTADLDEKPVVYANFSPPEGNSVRYPFPIDVGDFAGAPGRNDCFINYYDDKGLIYSEKTYVPLGYKVKDLRKVDLERELECPVGTEFAGSYTGSDGKTYKPGDEFLVSRSLSLYINTQRKKEVVLKLDGQVDEDGNRTLTENSVVEIVLTDNKMPETAPIPEHVPSNRQFGGWGVWRDGEWYYYYDQDGEAVNKDTELWQDYVLRVAWTYEVDYWFNIGPGAWSYINYMTLTNAYKGLRTPLKETIGDNKLPKTEDEIYRHGYDFMGWTLDGEEFTEDSILPVEKYRYILDANWKAKEMKMTVDANGGTFADGSTSWKREENIVYGDTLGDVEGEFPTPSRPGCQFVGWAYAADAPIRNAIRAKDVLDRTEDFTLYALWSRNDVTIYLDPNGGSFPPGTVTTVKTDRGARVELPYPERPGYAFVYWEDAAGGHGVNPYFVPEDADASYVLKAIWRAGNYKVRFNQNNGIGSMDDKTYTYDIPEELPAGTFTRPGYRFDGWNTKADGSGVSYEDQALVSKLAPEGTFTLYAQWIPLDWSVSFDPNGGFFTAGTTPSKTVKCGSAYGTLPEVGRQQYDFLGWWTSPEGEGRKVEATSVVEEADAAGGNIVLYARWSYADFILSFDLRGGVGSVGCTFADMVGKRKTGILLPKVVPERGAGWQFMGWSRTQDAAAPDAAYEKEKVLAGVTIKPDDTEENITLYAVWENDEPVLEYDANTTDKVTVPVSQVFVNGAAVVSGTEPTRTGFTFQGWALASDGAAVYQPGDTVLSAVSVKLYAVWNAQEAESVQKDGVVECKYKKDGIWHLTTLTDAIEKVPQGGEIIVLKALNSVGDMNLTGTKGYTLNLNGFVLYSNDMTITGSKTITIKNGTLGGGGSMKLSVSGGAKVTVDGVSLGQVEASGSGTSLTLRGETLIMSSSVATMISIKDSATATIEYAEVTTSGVTDAAYAGLIETENADLSIQDGYFWTIRMNGGSSWNPVVRQKGTGRLNLSGGYYCSTHGGTGECTTWWSAGTSNQTLIATEGGVSGSYQNGTDVGIKYPVFGATAVAQDHWFTPGSAGTESAYWGVYEEPGQERKKAINVPKLTNDDYLSGDTRFQLLQKRALCDETVTLGKEGQEAVLDLNDGRFVVSGQDVALSNFVLKNGVLEKTVLAGVKNNVTLKNGTIGGNARIIVDGTMASMQITLENMILEPGATFYLPANNLEGQFKKDYAYAPSKADPNPTPKYFGSTVLKHVDVVEGQNGQYSYVYKACLLDTPKVTFHSNYPKESGKAEITEEKDQALGTAFVLPGSFEAPAGYVLDHWNTEPDGSGSAITDATVYGDATQLDIYAIWRRNSCSVTFYRNDGQWADAASLGVAASATSITWKLPYGSRIGAFPAVTRPGYVLDGWYTEATGGTKVSTDTKVTEETTECYARWSASGDIKYTVIHQGNTIEGKTVTFGRQEKSGTLNQSVTIASQVQSIDGYTCTGYTVKSSTNPSGTTGTGTAGSFLILADGSVEVTLTYALNQKQITITAKKEEAGKTAQSAAQVSVNLSGEGKVTPGDTITTNTAGRAFVTYKYGSNVILTAQELPGYTFAGWSGGYTAADKSLRFRMPGEAVNVTALYRQITFRAGKNLTNIEAGAETVQMPGQSAMNLPDEAPQGCTYMLPLTAEEGYEMPESITLRRNGTDSELEDGKAGGGVSYKRSADKKTATFTVSSVDTAFLVTAAGVPKRYTASFLQDQSDRISAKPDTDVQVSHGETFAMTLWAQEGYDLPDADGGTLTVTMGGQTLGEGAYDYDAASGSLCIPGVTGNVTVSASAKTGYSVFEIDYFKQDADGNYSEIPYQTTRFSDKKTGDTVDVLKGGGLDPAYGKAYTGYEFDAAAGNITSGVVTVDGSLTLKIYYKRSEHTVSLEAGNFWEDGTSDTKRFRFGASVELALQERTGYDVRWSAGKVTGEGRKVSFTMPGQDMKVIPVYTKKKFSVLQSGLTHTAFAANTEKYAYYKTAYSAVIEPEEGYALPDGIVVKVSGTELAGDRFTYDPKTGQISVLEEAVTGRIEIIAAGVQGLWQVQVTLKDNISAGGEAILTASPENGTVQTGGLFNTGLTVNDPLYILPDQTKEPDKIQVVMGGQKLTEGDDYFYDRDSGVIRVKDITGDVEITVAPVEVPPTADYQVEHYKENLDGTYTKAQTVRKKGAAVGETVDAEDENEGLLKSYRGFVFDKSVGGTVSFAVVEEDGSTMLKLYYRRQICKLSLTTEEGISADISGDTGSVSESVPAGQKKEISFKYGENVTVSVSQVEDGSSFAGWYEAGEMRNKYTTYPILMSEDIGLVAKSETTSYEMIVEGKHLSSDLPEENYESKIPFGEKRTVGLTADKGYHLPDDISVLVDDEEVTSQSHIYTKETDGSSGKVELTVKGDTRLVLAAEPNRYKLVLDANGGKVMMEENGQGEKQAEMEAVYDAAYGSLPTAKRSGYTFLGWFDGPKGGEEITAETVHLTAGDATAYAHWKKQPGKDSGKKDPDGKEPGKEEPEGGGSDQDQDGEPEPVQEKEPETTQQPVSPESEPDGIIRVVTGDTPEDDGGLGRKLPEGEGIVHVPAVMRGGKIVPKDKKTWQAGRGDIHTVVFIIMDGAVIVHVNNVADTVCRAGVADTANVANAVLTGEEIKRLVAGDFIEIRIDVAPLDDRSAGKDSDLARDWVARKNQEQVRQEDAVQGESAAYVIDAYVDISVYMRVNEETWQEIHTTDGPIEMILDTPGRLLELSGDPVFSVLRIHEDDCTQLDDMDGTPETITFESSLFSTYAVMYTTKVIALSGTEIAEDVAEDTAFVCGLCHFCPTFLGICCFIWLVGVTGIIVAVILLFSRREWKKERGGSEK